MRGLYIDLRDLPWYFWLGIGLEAAGAGVAVLLSVFSLPGWWAGLPVFATGMVLALRGVDSASTRKRDAESEAAEGPDGRGTRRGSRVVGVLLVCVGLVAAVISMHGGVEAGELLLVSVLAVGLGVMYWLDRRLPARTFRASGVDSPLLIRVGVHVKYFVAMGAAGLEVLFPFLFGPTGPHESSWALFRWMYVAFAGLILFYLAYSYVWHCWIKRDYEEVVSFMWSSGERAD